MIQIWACFAYYEENILIRKKEIVLILNLFKRKYICTWIGISRKGNAGKLELVSKELNHLAEILHVYAGGLNFMT